MPADKRDASDEDASVRQEAPSSAPFADDGDDSSVASGADIVDETQLPPLSDAEDMILDEDDFEGDVQPSGQYGGSQALLYASSPEDMGGNYVSYGAPSSVADAYTETQTSLPASGITIPTSFARTALPTSDSDAAAHGAGGAWEGLGRLGAYGGVNAAANTLHGAGARGEAEPDGPLTEAETAGLGYAEVLAEARFRRRIARDYERFLTTYTDAEGRSVYSARINKMAQANGESLHVSYAHLVEASAFLAKLVANQPATTLAIFDEATMRVVLRLFEHYDAIRPEVHVRITDFPPCDALRDLRHGHLNALVRVTGVVTRRSGVFPQLTLVKYDCGRCGAVLGPFVQDLGGEGTRGGGDEARVKTCSECESRGPFTLNAAQTVYRNFQKLTLQEPPGSVAAGRLPRHREVLLLSDLIDAARPGELVEVTGVYRHVFSYALNTKNGFPVFATLIEANYVCAAGVRAAEGRSTLQSNASGLTEEDLRAIRALAAEHDVGARIVASIAPSIYGHANVKLALVLALFGGVAKNVAGKHPIRGDINVLLLGDPGTAKSQFLKYVEGVAPRAVYATGQGASAVGLTASVRKDPVTREWTLEGGALVLADTGVCLIDEFDKMNDADRTSIHEAMEQQSISISKAGIVTTLQARASVIAAANPVGGRYRPSAPLSENVRLTEPILSRFDVLCVVRDIVDNAEDSRLARHVVGSHMRSHPCAGAEERAVADALQSAVASAEPAIVPVDQALLKKYIAYARAAVRPELSQLDVDRVARLYADLRRESLATGALPITVRHVESMVRMAEARARMHLRAAVRADDIDVAIRVMLESFIASQKHSVVSHLRRTFSRYLGSMAAGGKGAQVGTADATALLLFALREMLAGHDTVRVSDLEVRARELRVHDVRAFLRSRAFAHAGYALDGDAVVRRA